MDSELKLFKTSFSGNSYNKLGLSKAGLLPTSRLSGRLVLQYVNCESCVTSGVFRLEESLLIFSGIANEMKSRKSGDPEADSFALGPVLV